MASDSTASAYITDALTRAQHAIDAMFDPEHKDYRNATINFVHHVTVVILLENLRRLDPALADRLTAWALNEDGIFTDGYPAELVHEWREQLAAGQTLDPISPDREEGDDRG